MILFLIAVLLSTLSALGLFLMPVLAVPRKKRTPAHLARLFGVLFLFTIAVPAAYGYYGRPGMPDFPQKSRDVVSAEYNVAEMVRIRRLERYLIETPDDGTMWEQLGAVYRANGLYVQAANAYRNAIEFGVPQNIGNWHALAETLIQANGGKIVAEAQKALENVLRYRPDNPKALYFLGLARLQNNDPQKALALWRYLEQKLSEDDPWLAVVEERILTLGKRLNIAPETVPPQAPKPLLR